MPPHPGQCFCVGHSLYVPLSSVGRTMNSSVAFSPGRDSPWESNTPHFRNRRGELHTEACSGHSLVSRTGNLSRSRNRPGRDENLGSLLPTALKSTSQDMQQLADTTVELQTPTRLSHPCGFVNSPWLGLTAKEGGIWHPG